MIDAAKEMLDLVKHMPEYTLWVLAGILFYKVFIIGSWIAIARLLINKAHDLLKHPRTITTVEKIDYNIKGLSINDGDVGGQLISTLDLVKHGQPYFHQFHADWLKDAVAYKLRIDGPPHSSYGKSFAPKPAEVK